MFREKASARESFPECVVFCDSFYVDNAKLLNIQFGTCRNRRQVTST